MPLLVQKPRWKPAPGPEIPADAQKSATPDNATGSRRRPLVLWEVLRRPLAEALCDYA